MTRSDGRVEPGQPLRSAFSARAWNRAQTAADIVLGANPGISESAAFPSQSRLIAMMEISGTGMGSGGDSGNFPAGSVVELTGTAKVFTWSGGSSPSTLTAPHSDAFSMQCANAKIWEPLEATGMYRLPEMKPWGVTAEPGKVGDVVPVIIRGIAAVRIRVLSVDYAKYAIPSIKRSSSQQVSDLRGVAETSRCACDNAAQIVALVSAPSTSPEDPADAETVWGVVVL